MQIIPELKARLVIYGYDCPADEITAQIGLEPTKIVRKGDVWHSDPKGQRPPTLHEENIWTYQLELPSDRDIFDALEHALAQVRPFKEWIAPVAGRYKGELSIYGWAEDTRPAMHVDREAAKELSELNLNLDIDVYSFTEDMLDTETKVEDLARLLRKLKSVK